MNQKQAGHGNNFNRRKIFAFKVIAIALPFIVILLIEAGLRIFGYGHDLSLFVEDKENPSCMVMNPHASERYFTTEDNATVGVYEPFTKKKAPETFRVFVLGESTTIGFPYMASASFDRWLLYRLMHTFPDRKFEIINVSLTAVNSYTVLGFAKEIVNYEPDALMIYCGQNEYYGALGVGSTSQLGSNRALIQSLLFLRSFRFVTLLENSYAGLKRLLKGRSVDKRETLMKRMAAKQEIPFNSSLYFKGIAQFKSNMEEVCSVLSKKGIPVFVSNLVSNEKDLKPFISSKNDTILSAGYHYSQGIKASTLNEFAKAKQQFILAKDLDMLRFRAPEAMNTIIAGLPGKYKGVYLVDTKTIFEAHSPHGIIGNETILEHVHPNIFGYSLMSDAFYRSIKQHKLITPESGREMTLKQLQEEMPVTLVDSLKGTFEIALLKEKWPFSQRKTIDLNKQTSYEARLAISLLYEKISWLNAMKNQMDYYSTLNDRKNMLKVAEASVLQIVNNPDYLMNVGRLCEEQGLHEKAKVYIQQAFVLSPLPETAQRLVVLFLKDDQPERALNYLVYLDKSNVSRPVYSSTISLITEIISCKNKLSGDNHNVDLLNQIAYSYYKMQNAGIALQYAERSFTLNKKNKQTAELLEKIKSLPVQKTN
jgi:tetratricopeptide (TPR) repeat protein